MIQEVWAFGQYGQYYANALRALSNINFLNFCFSLVQPLGPFIRYHETLNYDLGEVHQQHTRAARSLGRPTVSLSFTAHQRFVN